MNTLEVFNSRVGKRLVDATFDSWKNLNDKWSDERARAVDSVKKFLVSNAWQKGANLILHGPPGTGKDHLAVAMAHLLIQHNVQCVYRTSQMLLNYAHEKLSTGGGSLVENAVLDGQLLILSSPESIIDGGSLAANIVAVIAAHRNAQMLPTIVTTNIPDMDTLDDHFGEAAADRLLHDATVVSMSWPSFREGAPE